MAVHAPWAIAPVPTSARPRARVVRMVDVDHLLVRLKAMHAHQLQGGFNSHAHGVHKAIELIEQDLAAPLAADQDPAQGFKSTGAAL